MLKILALVAYLGTMNKSALLVIGLHLSATGLVLAPRVGGRATAMAVSTRSVVAAARKKGPPPKRPHLSLKPVFVKPKKPLQKILNPKPHKVDGHHHHAGGPLSSLSNALVFKPDLGACQSFKNGCHEGDIVTLPNNNVMQTMGAGLGMRVGGIRFEYAHGLHTGANFLGIRTHIP